MINLISEYSTAEREYNLMAFDSDPNMVYELTVCHSSSSCKNIEEDVLCIRQTMCEIKEEIELLNEQMISHIDGVIVIAYTVDDSVPVPAYLIIQKIFREIESNDDIYN